MIDFDNDRRFLSLAFSHGVEIPKWALLQILTALPSDAILFHVDFDFPRQQYHMVFWSGEFEPVSLGQETPSIYGWIDTVNLKAGLGDPPDEFMIGRSSGTES